MYHDGNVIQHHADFLGRYNDQHKSFSVGNTLGSSGVEDALCMRKLSEDNSSKSFLIWNPEVD